MNMTMKKVIKNILFVLKYVNYFLNAATKRQRYGFGLGKRMEPERRSALRYNFGLGKRDR